MAVGWSCAPETIAFTCSREGVVALVWTKRTD